MRRTRKERDSEKERERFTVTLVLLYLHAQPTYTGQSTEQPDTHFRHLRLDALGHQCFHSTLGRRRCLKVYKAITCEKKIQVTLLHFTTIFWVSYEIGGNERRCSRQSEMRVRGSREVRGK